MMYVIEHYRPKKELDQLLIFVDGLDNINTPKKPTATWTDIRWNRRCITPDRHVLVIHSMDLSELSIFVNDYVFYNTIKQPANLSIYVLEATNINMLPTAIRQIIDAT